MMKSPIRILAILIAATCLVNAHSQTDMKWFNADHSPTGARSSYVFGMKDRGGGFMVSKSTPPTRSVYMAYKSQATGAKILPFVHSRDYSGSDYYRDDEIVREFRFCSDRWETPHFSVTVYSPNWNMPDPAEMDADQQRLAFCPVQWIEICWDNSQNSYPAEILFGLQCPVSGSIGGEVDGNSVQGIHFRPYPQEEGYIVGLKGQADCDMQMVRYANVLQYFINDDASDGRESGGLIFKIPPGSKDSLFVLTVHFTDDNATDGVNSVYYYRELFQSPENIAEFAFPLAKQVKRYCRQRDEKLLNSGINPWRQFLIAHATHTYLANTMYIHSDIGDLWLVSEGDFRYLNTLDLTADMVFYELRMHPWTIRNILDTFSSRYFYYDQVRLPNNRRDRFPGGISFTHDMGRNSTMTAAGTSNYEYEYFMTHEELLNWTLCAAMYWTYTADNSWLDQNSRIFQDCLESMVNRDHHDESQRDGVPTMVTTYQKAAHEITTYDALDPGLKQPYENLYMAVKSWAGYVVLQHIFDHLAVPDAVNQSRMQASRAAQTITNYQVNDTDGVWLKALFDQDNPVKIIPAVESLVFPYKMGDLDAVSEDGRYGQLITALRQHLKTILTPGICIDPQTNVWKISSDTARTWQSKVYLCQYVAEHVFGMTGSSINGDVDETHTQIQLNSITGRYCWSEQIYSNTLEAVIGFHYPRGVSNSLWWENVDLSKPVADRLVLIPGADTLKKEIPNSVKIEAQESGAERWDHFVFTDIRVSSNSPTLLFSNDMTTWSPDVTLQLHMGQVSFYLKDSVAENVQITIEDLTADLGVHTQWIAIEPGDIVPVELMSFKGSEDGGKVLLSWQTATESNNYGFEIQRRSRAENSWQKIGFIRGQGTSSRSHHYEFKDKPDSPGVYYYRLKQIDTDGSCKFYNKIEINFRTPATITLSQNYPNPFNQGTTIRYTLPERSHIQLAVYNLQGHFVAILEKGWQNAGYHRATWEGIDQSGSSVSSGIYLYELQVGERIERARMVLIK